MHRLIYIAILGVAILALGVGCGSDSGDDETSVTVSKAQFVKSANAVCAKTQKTRTKAMRAYDKKLASNNEELESNPALEKKLDEVLIPSMRKQQEELEALGLPDENAEKVESMMEGLAAGIEKLEEEKLLGLRNAKQLEDFSKEAVAVGLTCSA